MFQKLRNRRKPLRLAMHGRCAMSPPGRNCRAGRLWQQPKLNLHRLQLRQSQKRTRHMVAWRHGAIGERAATELCELADISNSAILSVALSLLCSEDSISARSEWQVKLERRLRVLRAAPSL